MPLVWLFLAFLPCNSQAAPKDAPADKTFHADFMGEGKAVPYNPTPDQEGFGEDWAHHTAAAQGSPASIAASRGNRPAAATLASADKSRADLAQRAGAVQAQAELAGGGPTPGAAAPAASLAALRAAAFGPGERPRDALGALPAAALGARAPRPMPAAALSGMFDAARTRAALTEPKPGTSDASRIAAMFPSHPVAERPVPAPAVDPAAATAGARRVFVALELDIPAAGGDYRAAVAKLSRETGFSIDDKFNPEFAAGKPGRVSIRGWLPVEHMRQAVSVPGVARLEADPTQTPAAPDKEFRLVVKLTPGADAAASLSATLLRLSDAGFSWKRTESRDATGLVTLTGTLPQHSVARVMADASVVRVEPVGEGGASKPAPMPAPDAKSYLEWFSRHPIVLLVGLLIPLAGRVLRPYDR